MHLPDLIDDVHDAISPRLAALRRIGEAAGTDAAAAQHDMAALIAEMLREGCAPSWLDALRAQLNRIERNQEKTMSALTDLQAADAALKTEVATFLTDIAGRLGSVDDPSAEAVVADIQAQVAALQAADPANAAPGSTQPSPLAGDGTATPGA